MAAFRELLASVVFSQSWGLSLQAVFLPHLPFVFYPTHPLFYPIPPLLYIPLSRAPNPTSAIFHLFPILVEDSKTLDVVPLFLSFKYNDPVNEPELARYM